MPCRSRASTTARRSGASSRRWLANEAASRSSSSAADSKASKRLARSCADTARLDRLVITLVEAGSRLLPGTPVRLDAAVRAHCEGRNVRILTDSPVIAVTPKQVRLRGGVTVRSDLTIWTGGVTAPPLLNEAGLADKPRQWAPVTAALRSKRFDNVFVIGDAAALPHPLAKQAYYALQMGECAAENVRRALDGRTLRDFKPAAKPMTDRVRRPRHVPGVRPLRGCFAWPGRAEGSGIPSHDGRDRSAAESHGAGRTDGSPGQRGSVTWLSVSDSRRSARAAPADRG